MVAMLAVMAQGAGRPAEARQIHDDMLAQARSSSVSPYYLALVSVAVGELDRAFAYFEAAYAEKDGILIHLNVEPLNEPLWQDPRFPALLRQMKLRP